MSQSDVKNSEKIHDRKQEVMDPEHKQLILMVGIPLIVALVLGLVVSILTILKNITAS